MSQTQKEIDALEEFCDERDDFFWDENGVDKHSPIPRDFWIDDQEEEC